MNYMDKLELMYAGIIQPMSEEDQINLFEYTIEMRWHQMQELHEASQQQDVMLDKLPDDFWL